ncbi:THO complex subunit 4A [Cardamine amara subsp. amara]|uniref:THO complex subunit 4A n=1 Tax=Cardamine amara subsp. amara TaxID=228776 RepID=A0ABD1AQD0_CARAN
MSTGLDMSLEDMIAKNRKSRGGTAPARGSGSGSGPGPTRRNHPNRKSNRSAPYQSAKAPESTWEHDMFSDRSEDFPSRSSRSSAGIETGTKLYISNLDYGVMNEDIKELFAEVGELKRYTVHFDRSGRSKGTAEVVYSRRGDALAAVKKYNDVQLDGKPMKIEIVGANLQTAAASSGRASNASSNGAPWRGGQGRGGQQRGGGRGGGRGGSGRGGGGGRGRRPGKGPAEKISAEDLDADLDKYHSGDMETN